MPYHILRQLCKRTTVQLIGLPRWPELPHDYLSIYRLVPLPGHIAALPQPQIVPLPADERYGRSLEQWRELAHRLVPGMAAASIPEPYIWRQTSRQCVDLLQELLYWTPQIWSDVPELREQAEAALALEELS